MALNPQYTGVSPAVVGASYLNSRAILKVEEGYMNGATPEYVSMGLFEVGDQVDPSPFRRNLALSADRYDLRLADMNAIVGRNLVTSYVLNEPFESPNDNYSVYNGDFNIVLNTGASKRYMYLGAAGALKYEGFDVLSPADFKDVRVTTRMASSDFTPSSAAIFTQSLYRIKTDLDHSVTGNRIVYETQYIFSTGTTSVAQLFRRDYSGTTLIASGGFAALSDNTFYWFRSEVVDNTIRMYVSSDDNTYTNIISSKLSMEIYPGTGIQQTGYGKASIEFHTTVGVTFQIDNLEVVELGKIYTREDVVKATYALGGVLGVTVQPDMANFIPNFQPSAGSSWVLSNENLYLVGDAGGNSYHYYLNSGGSYNNFMAEVEVRGASGMRAGLMVGTTHTWYSSNTAFKLVTDSIEERFITSRITRTPVAEWLITKPDIWYKLRLIKRNKELFWLIDDKLFDYTIGNSFIDYTAVNVGVHSLRSSGVAGATLHYRNFKVSSMGDIIETVQIAPNTKISSVLDRYLPDDFRLGVLGNGFEVYRFGASRGTHNVPLSNIANFSQSKDDLIAPIAIVAEGQGGLAFQRKTGNVRKSIQADIADTTLLEDLSLTTSDDLKRVVNSEVVNFGRRLATFNLSTPLMPMVDIYDAIGLSSFEGNMAGNFHIQNIRKSYSASDGSFTQDLTLSYGATQF